MTTPELRLGYGRAELVLAPLPGRPDSWRLTASWYGKLSADFEAEYIETAEVIEFTDRLIAGMDEGEPFTARLTSGRNNPLHVYAVPVEDAFGFQAQLTPDGDDPEAELTLELDHVSTAELRTDFEEFRRSLAS
ncbi:hypothetical protein OG625_16435 [Streptomyces sp. NBC_01351]|uniref:hypothetical protein n=1 Tax=Streptomyces sp. NBC_01351 TaxID=2903833 RepID=UPI002E33AD47|nr:hypothetical protein [Streptomyces sp. NBC_01351]